MQPNKKKRTYPTATTAGTVRHTSQQFLRPVTRTLSVVIVFASINCALIIAFEWFCCENVVDVRLFSDSIRTVFDGQKLDKPDFDELGDVAPISNFGWN